MKLRYLAVALIVAIVATVVWGGMLEMSKAEAGGEWWRITRVDQGDSVCFVGENRYQVETFALSYFKK